MLLGFLKIVHDTFALQMRGQRAAATRLFLLRAAVGLRCGRIFVIGAASAVPLDRSSDIHALSFQLGFLKSASCSSR